MAQTGNGISIYFYDERIRFRKGTVDEIGNPTYIHLYINEKKKQMFIQACEERDNDAFEITTEKNGGEWRLQIIAKAFVKYLATLIGVPFPSDSLYFPSIPMGDDKTILIDLKDYQVIPYEMREN